MTERKQPDVLSAGDQCGGTIAHIKSVSGRKGLTTTRSRRRRVGGVGAEAGWRGGGGGVCGGGESEDVSDAPESF
jgi:hypothetical protein